MADTTRLPQGMWIEGALTIARPLNTIVRNTGDGELYVSDDAVVPTYTKLTNAGAGSGFTGIQVVSSGSITNYGTIQDALNAAASGETVLVYPGTYAESLTTVGVAANVRLTGFPNAQNVVIAGADATSTRILVEKAFTIRELTVTGPSAGANPAVDINVTSPDLAVTVNVAGQGAGGSGPIIQKQGTGLWAALTGLFHNGGTTTGPFVQVDAGTVIASGWIANAGSSSDFLKVNGGAVQIRDMQAQASSLYTCTDFIEAAAGTVQVSGATLPTLNSPATNAIHISGDGVAFDVINMHAHGSTFDILVDPALTGAGTEISMTAVDHERAKLSIPDGYKAGCDLYLVGGLDEGGGGDNPGFKFDGNVDIGTRQLPSSLSAGTGDSTTLDMVAYTFDGTATYVDVTAELSSPSGSTATWGTAANAGLYFGLEEEPFRMLDLENVQEFIGGASSLAVEVWTGAAWTVIDYMSADSDGAARYAESAFERANGDENCRLDTENGAFVSWAQNDPPTTGTPRYWLRFRNTGIVTQTPTVERAKLGVSFHEWKSTNSARFGTAEQARTFIELTGTDLATPSGGANAPGNANITVSTNVSYQQPRSLYATGNDERAGKQLQLPEGLDTSRALTLTLRWTTNGTSTNPVQWDCYLAEIPSGAVLNSTTIEKPVVTQTIAPTGVANQVVTTTFALDVVDLLDNDSFAIMLWRRGSVDTNPDGAIALTIALSGFFID